MHSTCTVSHSCFLAPRSQTSSLFPYTTLFRSIVVVVVGLTIAVALIPLSLVLAIVVGAVAALLGCTLAYVSSPVLRITGTHFSMGRARIEVELLGEDRKSTRLNSSHVAISYAVLCLKKKEIGGAKV